MPKMKIGELANSKDNAIDKSIEALAEYQKILSSENEPKNNLVNLKVFPCNVIRDSQFNHLKNVRIAGKP